MAEKRGGVTHRGLLWAGGLAATPLAPAGAFLNQAGGLPWELGIAASPHTDRADRELSDQAAAIRLSPRRHGEAVPLDPTGLLGRGNPFATKVPLPKRN
jgi:hypothetical protein